MLGFSEGSFLHLWISVSTMLESYSFAKHSIHNHLLSLIFSFHDPGTTLAILATHEKPVFKRALCHRLTHLVRTHQLSDGFSEHQRRPDPNKGI